jgi:hypothetical protein
MRYNFNEASDGGSNADEEGQNIGMDVDESTNENAQNNTTPTRKSHTKHISLSLDATQAKDFLKSIQHKRKMSADFETINENSPFLDRNSSSYMEEPTQHSYERKSANDDKSISTTLSSESSSNLAKPMSRLIAVKDIVLTHNRALLNSLPIIFIGGTGFYLIEGMSLVDSFYFTTVLLTTVGSEVRLLHVYFALLLKSTLQFLYLDIVPVSDAGKGEAVFYKDLYMPRLSHLMFCFLVFTTVY